MNEKWVVVILLAVILVMNWVGFIALDKKIDRALERQGEINECSYQTNSEQSESIRLLKTDTQILMNIAISQDFCEEEE